MADTPGGAGRFPPLPPLPVLRTPTATFVMGEETLINSSSWSVEGFAAFGSWWLAAYHIGAAEMADAILEPRVGGAGTSAESMAANATGASAGVGASTSAGGYLADQWTLAVRSGS